MRRLAMILTLGLTAAGCGMWPWSSPPMRTEPVRYLALGDSYTIGTSVEPAERWPEQLAAMMRARGLIVDPPVIVARNGWTTADLIAGLTEAAPTPPFDFVTLLIGVNNQFQGRGLGEYREEFIELLRRATAFAGGDPTRVVVVSIPDWSATPFAASEAAAGRRNLDEVSAAIDIFNEVNRIESQHAGVWYIDITIGSRGARVDAALVADDGLHPSGLMYREWTGLALPVAMQIVDPRE